MGRVKKKTLLNRQKGKDWAASQRKKKEDEEERNVDLPKSKEPTSKTTTTQEDTKRKQEEPKEKGTGMPLERPIQTTRKTLATDPQFIGRRILSCQSLKDAFNAVANHCRTCENPSSQFVREDLVGISTSVVFECSCGWTVAVSSDTGKEQLPLNEALSMGAINAPIGYDDLTTLLTCLDLPNISADRFRSGQTDSTNTLTKIAKQNMKENAAEEVRLAIEANQFINVGGITMPWVKGIVDGGWVKRSLGHSYDSNYGHAAIIGERTKKILFYNYRQKTCKVCTDHANAETPAPPHKCYQNWTGSSTAMEADIIKEGFENSIIEHHFVYAYFIGDGDSSVHAAVKDVYPGIEVTKHECLNHVIRNFNRKLTPSLGATKIQQIQNNPRG